MSKELSRPAQVQSIMSALKKAKPAFESVLKNTNTLKFDRLLTVVQNELKRCPKLSECTISSLGNAVMLAAEMGLEPDSRVGYFYIIPYKTTATIIVGYKGLIELAMRSPHVKSLYAQEVYEGDRFEVLLGSDKKVIHVPNYTYNEQEQRKLIAVYAIATMENGDQEIEIMGKHEVDQIRSRSKSSNNGPWVTDYGAMARKTVIRRICKYLPMSFDASKAASIEEAIEVGAASMSDFGDFEEYIDNETGEIVKDKNTSEDLKNKLKS